MVPTAVIKGTAIRRDRGHYCATLPSQRSDSQMGPRIPTAPEGPPSKQTPAIG